MSEPAPEKKPGQLRTLLGMVPGTVWVLIIGQVVAFAVWLIKLEDRIVALNRQMASIEARLGLMDVRDTRAGSLISERVAFLETRTAWLISAMTGVAPLAVPPPSVLSPIAPAPADPK